MPLLKGAGFAEWPSTSGEVNVTAEHMAWHWSGKEVRIGVDRLGAGPTVLLLPAMSSISSRGEMRPLQERLAADFSTVAVDWPGFGDESRP
ncbi:MAG: hypothetical protein AB1648_05005 [Pseudomonadota bacterium]|jgi:pimeloyl-ACP methyl ester carboxylesterase